MTKSNSISAVVIPARLASTRLPRKLLLRETGQPLIQHTYAAASEARLPALVCVATEDEEIRTAVAGFGGNCLMTSAGLQSGTERIAEVVTTSLTHADIIVNVQGDEPEMEPSAIDQLITMLEDNPAADIATLATPIRDEPTLRDPSRVKVVCDHDGRAIYFSRSPIPYPRGGIREQMFADPPTFLQHLGIYAYRRKFLLGFGRLPKSPLEDSECLEQLRALSAGVSIQVGVVDKAAAGIDTPDDYRRFVLSKQRAERQAA